MIKKQYNFTVDILRSLAILAVVFIHTTTKTIQASLNDLQNIPFTLFLNQISRFAVPLFFMISGFILEQNYHLNGNYLTYLKKRLNRILIPYLFWSAVYYFFVFYKNRNPVFFDALIRGETSYQFYFIPALLIFYLFFPFLHKYLKIIGNIWVMIFLFIAQLILLNYDYSLHPPLSFYPSRVVILNYFSFILGVVLSANHEKFINFINKWKIFLFFGSIILAFFVFYEGLNGYLSTNNYLAFYSQWRPSVLIYTILLSGFIYWFFNKKPFNSTIVKNLSCLSFFVFFVHVIIIEILWSLVGENNFRLQYAQNLWWDPVFFISVVLISFLTAHLVHKIPLLSKITG